MRTLLRLVLLLSLLGALGVVLVKILYEVTWNEAMDITGQFIADLLA